jgi:glycosyltransferase involved in cell wall biosynthesis
MRIGVYARGITEKSGGVKVYIREMTEGLIRNISSKDELFIFHNSKNNLFSKKKNVHEISIQSKSKLLADLVQAPKIINDLNLDVVFFPKNVIPFGIKTKKVLTIHDLAYYMPQFDAYKMTDTLYMKFMIKSSVKRADKVVAISNNTKKDIENILKTPKEKISVIYEATNSNFRVIKDKKALEEVRKKYDLTKPFIFYAGSISPRKNVKRLITAFKNLANKDLDLVITGNKLWNNNEEMAMIKKEERIKLLGLVPEDHLPLLYNLANFYIYPSLYEGFGLPTLEAQQCGCAVLSSNASSLPEVGGKGALYFNPYSEREIKEAIEKIERDSKLKKDLIKKGLANVKTFSWDKASKELLEVIKNV